MRLIDGEYSESRDNSATIAEGLTAAGAPLFPPGEWFQDPGFDGPTPMVVTDDGRIMGHIATWDTDHVGLPPGTKPPHSATDYSLFKTGVLRTDTGEDVHVGQLTLAGGHAPLNASAADAVKHYDDTASAVADITVGEDQHGIWVSGGLRPDVSDEKIRALRASAPSGDWRPAGTGSLELVAVCQVNTPGFPVARAMVASGEITALVAAGASTMYELQQEESVYSALQAHEERVDQLEAMIAAAFGDKNRKKFVDEGEDEDDTAEGDETSTEVEDEVEDEGPDDSEDDPEDEWDDGDEEETTSEPEEDPRKKALRERFRKVKR